MTSVYSAICLAIIVALISNGIIAFYNLRSLDGPLTTFEKILIVIASALLLVSCFSAAIIYARFYLENLK